jgi:WD40 repeat protein
MVLLQFFIILPLWNILILLFKCLAYDRYIKLWDTETGECISRFTSRKIPYCAKFHPEEDKQHLFVAGTSDKKIICVSHQNAYIIMRSIIIIFVVVVYVCKV